MDARTHELMIGRALSGQDVGWVPGSMLELGFGVEDFISRRRRNRNWVLEPDTENAPTTFYQGGMFATTRRA